MGDIDKREKTRILDVLETVADLTIASIREDGFPQATTVSYVSDGMTVYFGTSKDSQKAANLARDSRVSITVNKPYRFWKDIVGLSAAGHATRVSEAAEYRKVGRLLFARFPDVHEYASAESEEVALFRIDLSIVTLLDYRQGFGHSSTITMDTPGTSS